METPKPVQPYYTDFAHNAFIYLFDMLNLLEGKQHCVFNLLLKARKIF